MQLHRCVEVRRGALRVGIALHDPERDRILGRVGRRGLHGVQRGGDPLAGRFDAGLVDVFACVHMILERPLYRAQTVGIQYNFLIANPRERSHAEAF